MISFLPLLTDVMESTLKIGTRESELAVWQATEVQQLLKQNDFSADLVRIKSEGDIDLKTPLYEMGVQGIFTRSLDIDLLNKHIDIAVHSMKDVPTQLPKGIVQAAVLRRGNFKDLFVLNPEMKRDDHFKSFYESLQSNAPGATADEMATIATSSTRRRAQWLHRYPSHTIENLRGNVNTRMRKVSESQWHGAIFAAAGLERIGLKPSDAVELDWMLPAPSQGAIMVVCREGDERTLEVCSCLNDEPTATCTKIEKDFLRQLMGGCTTPIGALAEIENAWIFFRGNILSLDGSQKVSVEKRIPVNESESLGRIMAIELLDKGGSEIANAISKQL